MCCRETGNAGLAILCSIVITSFLYGCGCFVYAAFIFFREELDRSKLTGLIHMAAIIVMGLFVCLGAIIAAFFDLDLNAGYAGFALVFVVQSAIMLSLLYAFKYNKSNGTVNTVVLALTPLCQGLIVVGVLFLLVESGHFGRTAMMGIIIGVIVIDVCHGLGLILCAIYFFIKRDSEFDGGAMGLIQIVLLVIGAVMVCTGTFIAMFFRLSDTAAIVGFSMALLVQGAILAWFAYPYWTKGREYHSILRLVMLSFSALFAGVTFIGILAAAIRIMLGAEI